MLQKQNLVTVLLCAALCGCASPEYLVRDGVSEYEIIRGNHPDDQFAEDEFREIMRKGTGVEFRKNGKKKIYIGSSSALEKAVGKEKIAGFRDGETLVMEKDGNIYLIGGGERGTLYAVYDFLEKYLDYRCYGRYPGAETYRETADLRLDGRTISTYPSFSGFRINYNYAQNESGMKFMMRNRNNGEPFQNTSHRIPRYRSEFFRPMAAQHGLFLFVPPTDKDFTSFLKVKWKGMFESHPEYFSMDAEGKRIPNGQLCFSNPELKKLLTRRFLKVVSLNGKGVYMLGSNDSHNVRYCFCPDCTKLAEKYKTNGGPLWDYILELCAELKKYPGVYVTSLAYKGPEQTELAPEAIIFPENFICDAAFLNSDRPLKAVADIKLPDGRIFNRLKNLKKWTFITKHVSYWYYGGVAPSQIIDRMQEEFQELKAAGVRSVGACGTGGGIEFGDISEYMFFQLLRNPEMNTEKVLNEILMHKYGKAAPLMREYIRDLEQEGFKSRSQTQYVVMGADDAYDKMTFLPAKKIVKWSQMFDQMEQLVKNSSIHKRNVAIARIGVDCWCTVFASRISKECPEWELEPEKILKRGLNACTLAEKAGMVEKGKNIGRRILESMQYYAYLKSDALPVQLIPLAKNTVIHRFLPENPPHFWAKTRPLIKDLKAAAGIAMFAKLPPEAVKQGKLSVQFWDSFERKWLLKNASVDIALLKTDEYTLVRLGECRLPRQGCMVFGNAWGTSADIRALGRYYDPSYHEKRYEFFASIRISGPAFSPQEQGENRFYVDQIFLLDKGMPKLK